MTKPTLIMTVGLPRSGKTTWAREASKNLVAPIVSPDQIRLALHGQRFYQPAEAFVWYIADLMVKSLFAAGHSTVILDGTFGTRKRRDPWKNNQYDVKFKIIDTSKDICLERAKRENDQIIIPVIEKMAKEFEPLGKDETVFEY